MNGVLMGRLALGLAATCAGLTLLTGCGGSAVVEKPAPAASPAAELDVYRPADVKFFKAHAMSGALESEYYPSIESAATDSTAVVIGRIVGVGMPRAVGGEGDSVTFTAYKLQIVEVLHGKLAAEHSSELLVEFVGGDPTAALPTGQAIWFLHRKGDPTRRVKSAKPLSEEERDRYRVINSQGLYLQGDGHVVDPIAEPHPQDPSTAKSTPQDAATEGQQHTKLSDLATKIKKIA